ncbi:SseB family protein [Rothia kristinae]|uniref:SseB family protein n=1 Tax=Rothia kristinae TaxID=37923 RepID=UPI00341D433C
MSTTPSHRLTERPGQQQREQRVQEAVNALGHWLLSSTQTTPGWDQLIADFAPAWSSPGSYLARISEIRDGEELVGSTGAVGPATTVVPLLEQLRAASYEPDTGAWLSASIVIDAQGWPEPQYQVGLDAEYEEEPASWLPGEEATAAALAQDLRAYPRTAEALPAWMAKRLEEAGLAVPPAVPEETGSDAAQPEAAADGGTADGGTPGSAAPAETPPAAAQQSAPTESAGTPPSREATPAAAQPTTGPAPNPDLLRGLEHYGRRPEHRTQLNVLRALMGGQALLDVSGSDFQPGPRGEQIGPGSTLRLQTVQGPDGATLLAVFAAEDTARALHAAGGTGTAFRTQARPGAQILRQMLEETPCDGVVVEPNGRASCRLDRSLIAEALAAPHLDAAKEALLEESMPRLLGSLIAPDARLLIALDGPGEDAYPIYVQTEDGSTPETMLLFTSAPEAAAIDPELTLRAAPARQALQLAVDAGAGHVRINALSPSAVLPIEQVRELLELAAMQDRL